MEAPRRCAYQADLADHRGALSLRHTDAAITVLLHGSITFPYPLAQDLSQREKGERRRKMTIGWEREKGKERGYRRTTHMPAPLKPAVDEQIRRAGPCSPLSLP
jgi:hypothetical protein